MTFLRYPAYKDSGVAWLGEIPAHWSVSRIKNAIADARNGVWGDEPSEENSILCVRVADFNRQNFTVSLDNRTYRGVAEKDREGRLLQRNDLLLEKSGGGENQPVGFVVIYEYDEPAVSSNFVARLALKASSHPRYFLYCFAKLYSERVNIRSIKQNTGIQNLDAGQYFDEPITFPPLPEQHTIAAFLDTETARIDTLVAKQVSLIATLQEKRRALISHVVTKGLDPAAPMKDSGVPWLGEVPKHWEVTHLKRIARIRYGLGQPPREHDQGVPLIRATNIDAGKITECDLVLVDPTDVPESKDAFLTAGEIIVVRSGAYTGDSSIIPSAYEGAVAGYDMVVTVVRAIPQFVAWSFLGTSVAYQFDIAKLRAAQPHLNAEELGETWVVLPTTTEQHAIVTHIEKETSHIDTLIAKAQEMIAVLREHRTALVAAAVTGQIDVRGV